MRLWLSNGTRLLLILSISVSWTPLAAQDKDNGRKLKPKDDIEMVGERDVGKGMNFYSLEKEIALGKGMAQQIEQQSRIIQDPVIAEYVNRVGQNLVNNSDAQVPFTIKVIDSDDINAFALPGGFFFVNSGLILASLKANRNWPASWRMRSPTSPLATAPRTPRGGS